jgi:hypothetical protein
MTPPAPAEALTPRRKLALRRAHDFLERPDFAARVAQYAGRPFDRALRLVPGRVNQRIAKAVEKAILAGLGVAIRSLGQRPRARPASAASTLLASASGGVSGFFGPLALALELPVTTTLMLRSIAEIARHHGEDLSRLEARLACLEVLGLGARKSRGDVEVGYYATRTMLARLTADASAMFVERGAATVSAPAAGSLVAEIAARFGVVVSERAAASALPVLGALGGASVNALFMNHFQRVAHGHFTVRRLERQCGVEAVRAYYESLGADRSADEPWRPLRR